MTSFKTLLAAVAIATAGVGSAYAADAAKPPAGDSATTAPAAKKPMAKKHAKAHKKTGTAKKAAAATKS